MKPRFLGLILVQLLEDIPRNKPQREYLASHLLEELLAEKPSEYAQMMMLDDRIDP